MSAEPSTPYGKQINCWATVFKAFEEARTHPDREAVWYLAWTPLLNLMFLMSNGFACAPQYIDHAFRAAPDASIFYTLSTGLINVCVYEAKSPAYDTPAKRREADLQIRRRFYLMNPSGIRVSYLYGISCIGSKFCIYQMNTRTGIILPARLPGDDCCPKEWWGMDAMTREGGFFLSWLANEVRKMVKDLPIDPRLQILVARYHGTNTHGQLWFF